MKQRGRKSTASLSVLTFERPPMEPPTNLNSREAEYFRQFVACRPADYYAADNVGLLVGLVRALAANDRLARELNSAPFEEIVSKHGTKYLVRLLAMTEAQTRLAMMLMTRLRLTVQQTMRADRAAVVAKHTPTLPRPWSHP